MADKKYKYFGPLSAVTLAADADHPKGRNVQLVRGIEVTLPEDNDYVKSLVARKYLVPVDSQVTASAVTATAASQTAATAKTATEGTATASTTATSTTQATTSTGSETKTGA